MTTTAADAIETAIPDLSAVPLDRIGDEGGPGLARAIAEYRARLKAGGETLSSFQAGLSLPRATETVTRTL